MKKRVFRRRRRVPWKGWSKLQFKQFELVKKLRAAKYEIKGYSQRCGSANAYGHTPGEVSIKVYGNRFGLAKVVGVFLTSCGTLQRACEDDYIAQGAIIIHGQNMSTEAIYQAIGQVYLAERRRLKRRDSDCN